MWTRVSRRVACTLKMEVKQVEIEFIIEKNEGGGNGYSITENPNTDYETVRSPFDTIEEARKHEEELSEYWGFKAVELKARPCSCPSNYHTMFEKCRNY